LFIMADADIELPLTSSLSRTEVRSSGITQLKPGRIGSDDPAIDHTADSEEKFHEKSDEEQEEEQEGGPKESETGEIVYHYLTFATELPNPATIYPSSEGQEPPPPLPDLVKYTSPFEWSATRKNIIIWISCVITALTAFTAGAYSPGVGQMTKEWHVSSVAALVGITTFTSGMCSPVDIHSVNPLCSRHRSLQLSLGFAIAPMILAPLSEINGRRPVFIASGILFVICQLCTGITRSYAGMLIVRFFVGVGGSTFSTMGKY
jgi:hypothetical protein